ncbi:GATA zinc finger domain-containing protein 14-like [Momordica charantia]|uniref:GATA zinc finger domain-containing protein 14-like n=1 Tax=Momordica charantia TaxID=3673 RepID=A0A6J1BR68_MOMCH|nr:GATA zinc finger domain-containing protein 14-like [Momordica charantia]
MAFDCFTFSQWLCCGWTWFKECCACCQPPSPTDGGPNGPQNTWVKIICANCPQQCMCCLGLFTCCNCGGGNQSQSQSQDGSNNNNSPQIAKAEAKTYEAGNIEDKEVAHQSHYEVESNNNNSLQMFGNTTQSNEIGKIQGDNYGTQKILNNVANTNIYNQYPTLSDSLDEQLKNDSKRTTIINQEIFGNGIAVQNNIYNNRYYIQHTRSEPDFPSLGMKSDDEPEQIFNQKITGTGTKVENNYVSRTFQRWNSFPEDHVRKVLPVSEDHVVPKPLH